MPKWTSWRKIADKDCWYSDFFDWSGPACYELSIAGSRGGNRQIVYVGETINEKKRISAYASNGSHISHYIDYYLKNGQHLYYRAQSKVSKQAAVATQNNLLARFDYSWNTKRNKGVLC